MKPIDRAIASYLVAQAIAGTATAFNLQRLNPAQASALVPLYGLAGLALIAGVGSFFNKSWARWLGVIAFAAQTIEIVTPNWSCRLFLAFRLAISMGWSGQVEIGINFLALAAFVIALLRTYRLSKART